MTKPPSLFEKLDALKNASSWRGLYDEFVERLRILNVGAQAPRQGDRFPDIVLPDHLGRHRTLDSLLKQGPLVLSFIRGGWCPYCASELQGWHAALPSLENAGGKLAIVSGELQGRSRLLADKVGSGAIALCDVDHGLALQLGLAFHLGPKMFAAYEGYGVDFNDLYGGIAGILPVPATFVIGQDRTIEFAYAEPDFRLRAEPEDIVDIVASLRG